MKGMMRIAVWALAAGVRAALPGVTLSVEEPWSGVFAGQEQVFHVTGRGVAPFDGVLGWEWRVSDRVLERGEQALSAGAARAAIRLRVPPVKPGVVMRGALSATYTHAGQASAAATVARTVWIFSPEPFSGRTAWLEGLKLRVFDPVGRTAELLTRKNIPFTEIRNADLLSGVEDGVLVIGEGLSLRDYRGVFEGALKAAAAGAHVLFLAPAEGEVSLPLAGEAGAALPVRVMFGGSEIIAGLDKRLDHAAWAPDGRMIGSRLAVRGEWGGAVIGAFGAEADGWPWVEIQPGPGAGRLICCGFALVAKWADSPTPRYLLLRMLEKAGPGKPASAEGE